MNYIEISALGIALLFISMPANIAVGAFPPFGTVSYSLVALGAYIFLAGIYSSAISASADIRLRQLMRKSFKESGLIDNIGFANLNHELQKQVTDLLWTQRDIIRKETDVESFSISESDIKKYMDQVLYENKDHLHRIAKHGEATISREGSDTQKGDSTAA